MSKNSKVAFCGIITALSALFVFITGLIPFMDYVSALISGILLAVTASELGYKWALGSFAASSALSIFFCPNKESVVFFIMFFGYYPMMQQKINTINSILLKWILKALIFNFAFISANLIIIYILGMPLEEMDISGKYSVYIVLAFGNIAFIVCDMATTRLLEIYRLKYKPVIKRIFK